MNELIAETYTRIMGRPVDSKTMAYWANSLSTGSASLTTFIQHLLQLPEYKQRVETMFKQIYFDIIGTEDFDDNFQSFWTTNEHTEVMYDDIQVFVKSCRIFKDRITKQVMDALDNADIAVPDDITNYVDMIINTHGYTIQTMIDALKKQSAVAGTQTLMAVSDDIDLKYLFIMEETFGRALFVQEYFKYKNSSLTPQEIFAKHTHCYKSTQRVYSDYCNIVLSEWEYIRKYIDLVDKETFEGELIEEVIQSFNYALAMKNVLKEWYINLFDISLDADDLQYIFEKVKIQKLHLSSDGIIKVLKNVKAETDAYIEEIFPIYQKVLNRQPDMQEISSHLPQYRSGVPVTLENDLIMSLEFHDIIKEKIKHTLGNVTPSKLYSVLKYVTNQFTTDTTMEDVDRLITESIV
jgi:hypothetical protein